MKKVVYLQAFFYLKTMLLIVDNQSAFIKRFKRNYLNERDIPYVFFDHNEPIKLHKDTPLDGIILSGGRGNPYEPLNLTANFVVLMRYEVPVIGFCLSHEIIAVAWGGHIKKLPAYHNKKEWITVEEPGDPIFDGFAGSQLYLQKQHAYHVSSLPDDFIRLGSSTTSPNEIIRHKEKPIYGFQAHPEVSGKDGMLIMDNFMKMCGINS